MNLVKAEIVMTVTLDGEVGRDNRPRNCEMEPVRHWAGYTVQPVGECKVIFRDKITDTYGLGHSVFLTGWVLRTNGMVYANFRRETVSLHTYCPGDARGNTNGFLTWPKRAREMFEFAAAQSRQLFGAAFAVGEVVRNG